ncbi:RNA polymerase sigma factor [Croceivirga thetidis]|uniref:RNA polymerase sigma factor n=1 Tax=Croceivirga thetidis TaxID=2721623 RepID=A0ABX1GU32_9FLAO|nr:sigma-70 family RNA polymerase sigma factor [Croceivirga thetidis]NKI33459.1 sigma-70 family RNA polymerase sigma factor [Croceivirga thetidis]
MTNNQPNIKAILAGDSREFSALVDAYKNIVFTVALRMLKNREEAEEVAQDTFIKVYKSLERFKGDSKLSTWIYRIAYNTCLDRLKKNNKDLTNVAIDEINGFEIKDVDNALELIADSEKSDVIKACIAKLSPKDSALLTLFYFEERSLKELGEILSMNQNSVKVGLFRARGRLATILKQNLEPEIIRSYGAE